MTDSDQPVDKLTGRPLQLTKATLLPGVASGQYEQLPVYDKAEFRSHVVEEVGRRDNRINIRISGKDLTELQKQALAHGIPAQSLIANIIHRYVQGELVASGAHSGVAAEVAAVVAARVDSSRTSLK
jgi:predicted DNA binding CopG/RHH family protein